MFFPMADVLALNEHLLGLSVVTTPIQLAGGSPVLAYNVAMLLSYVLSGFFMYLLVLRLTGSALAAWCAGVAFAFAPYRAGQLAHIQVLTSQWMPAMLLGLHGFRASGRRRWLALFGVAWLLQALSNGYYMLFLPVLIALWLAWFIDWRRNPGSALHIVSAGALASLPLVPLLMKYRAMHDALGLSRDLGDIRQFSATAGSFLQVPPLLAVWPVTPARSAEDFLFPGITAVAVSVGAFGSLAARGRLHAAVSARSPLIFYGLATVAMWVLALGPGGEPGGPPSLLRPYAWLLWLPGFEGLRVPARFAMAGVLCLATTAGLAMAHLASAAQRRRAVMAAVVLAGLAADGLMRRVPLVSPPPRVMIPASAGVAVVELPPNELRVNTAALYRSIHHRRPLVNGYAGHMPHHYAVLTLALWRGDPTPLLYLARDRPLVIVVNALSEHGPDFRRTIESIPGVEPHGISSAGPMFLLPTPPAGPTVPRDSEALPVEIRDAGRERLEIDFGAVYRVQALEFPLRDRYDELAPRVLIEASDDGRNWREAWVGWTGAFALEAVLQDPIVAPVRIPLPGVRARHLRVYPAADWMGEEIRVKGDLRLE